MFTRTAFETSAKQAIQVSRIDRWFIHQRLQELMIPSWCPDDGSLQVTVNNPLTVVLVRSVVQQFVASRPELVNWLERCWQAKV
jgi:hypothetical protein